MKSEHASINCVALLVLCGCQTTPPEADAAVVKYSTEQMATHFECANFYSKINNTDAITQSLDKAAIIGESNGLSANQIMGAYATVKNEQEQKLLTRATELALQRKNLIPRISGKPPRPNAMEEMQAWRELYEATCKSQ